MRTSYNYTFLILFSIFFINDIIAQLDIPNEGFEEWVMLETNKEVPLSWVTKDEIFANTHTYCKKESIAQEGEFSLSLHNYYTPTGTCTPSSIELGVLDSNDPGNRGIPFTQRPGSMAFYFKYYNNNPTSLYNSYANILLQRWDNTLDHEVTIGVGGFVFTENIDEFTYIEIPIDYLSEEIPEKLYITFGNTCNGTDSMVLSIDYVGLIEFQSTSTNELATLKNITTFPNPIQQTDDALNVRFFANNNTTSLDVINLLGQTVKSLNIGTPNGWNTVQVNTTDLAADTYLVKIDDGQQSMLTKFIKVN